MNPFKEKPLKYDSIIMDWQTIYPKSYSKIDADPYTKLRIILANGAEFESVWYSHQSTRRCNNNDIRREVASIRRSEQQQQKLISCLKPIDENILETTIGYEQLAVDLTIALAKNEPDPYVKMALDFALLEDFDHLYRYANLLDMEYGVKAENLVNNYVEVMPARPTIAEHIFPYDTVKNFTKGNAALITKLNIGIITAAEQQTMNYYMNQAAFYTSDLGRKLYQEIGMIEEQHVTHYGGLMNPDATPLECLLLHEYTECYMYYSNYMSESCPMTKKVWEQCFVQEITHLHIAADLLKKYEKKEWQEVIPGGDFPALLSLRPEKAYLRDILSSTVTLTADKESYKEVSKLPPENDFARYQTLVNTEVSQVPSHMVIDQHIKAKGEDYRYEESPSPIKTLQCRKEDNVSLARPASVLSC